MIVVLFFGLLEVATAVLAVATIGAFAWLFYKAARQANPEYPL